MFALTGGVSTTQSPAELILNRKIDFNAHCRVEFGQYVQTHEEHDNSMNARTVGAIATRPTGNTQGGYYFIRLDTGRRINRSDWTPLPMPETVVDQIHRLARRAKAKTNLTFTNLQNEDLDVLYSDIPGIDDEDELAPENNADDLAGVDNGDDEDINDSDYNPESDGDEEENENESDEEDESGSEASEDDNDDDDNDTNPFEAPGVDDEIPGVNDETTGVDNDEIPGVSDETTGVDNDEITGAAGEMNDEDEDTADEDTTRMAGQMKLRPQPRKEYNVFNINGEEEMEPIVLLQLDRDGDLMK
jgi:hypothetical protein